MPRAVLVCLVGMVRPDKGLLLALGADRQADQYRKIIGRIHRFRATRACCIFLTAAQIGCTYRAEFAAVRWVATDRLAVPSRKRWSVTPAVGGEPTGWRWVHRESGRAKKVLPAGAGWLHLPKLPTDCLQG